MKVKFAVLIFMSGMGLIFLGLLLKLGSYPLASEMLTLGLLIQMIGIGLILYTVLVRNKN